MLRGECLLPLSRAANAFVQRRAYQAGCLSRPRCPPASHKRRRWRLREVMAQCVMALYNARPAVFCLLVADSCRPPARHVAMPVRFMRRSPAHMHDRLPTSGRCAPAWQSGSWFFPAPACCCPWRQPPRVFAREMNWGGWRKFCRRWPCHARGRSVARSHSRRYSGSAVCAALQTVARHASPFRRPKSWQ